MQKQYRLTKSASFNYIYRKGKSIANKYMVVIYAKTYRHMKVGFSVSKKIGNSVVRNRTKRLLRESFRHMIPEINSSYNYVVIARADIVNLSYSEVGESLKGLLAKEGLINEA